MSKKKNIVLIIIDILLLLSVIYLKVSKNIVMFLDPIVIISIAIVLLLFILMYSIINIVGNQEVIGWAIVFIFWSSILLFINIFCVIDFKIKIFLYVVLLGVLIKFSILVFKENAKQKKS